MTTNEQPLQTNSTITEFSNEEGKELMGEIQAILDKYSASIQVVPRHEIQLVKIVDSNKNSVIEPVVYDTEEAKVD